MPEEFPAPLYSETVLAHNFEHARRYFLEALIQIHYAHTRMLAKQGIVTAGEERALLAALYALDCAEIAAAPFDGSFEDLFYLIEGRLEETAGRVLL